MLEIGEQKHDEQTNCLNGAQNAQLSIQHILTPY